jgi:hypothetical protein
MAVEESNKLDLGGRISIRTADLVRDEFARRVGEIERKHRLKFRGRKAKLEAILSAVMIDFLSRPVDEQDEAIVRCMPVYETIVAVQVGEAPDPGTDLIMGARKAPAKIDRDAPAEAPKPKAKGK